ncbi:MAG TPA: hypothetical protein VLX67_04295 [Stellaceae bacterium]|nr:hypothetical protein [Stellaceae bacterium]
MEQLPAKDCRNHCYQKAKPEERACGRHQNPADASGLPLRGREPRARKLGRSRGMRKVDIAAPGRRLATDVFAILPDFDRRRASLARSTRVLDRCPQVREMPLKPSTRKRTALLVTPQTKAIHRLWALDRAAVFERNEQHQCEPQ